MIAGDELEENWAALQTTAVTLAAQGTGPLVVSLNAVAESSLRVAEEQGALAVATNLPMQLMGELGVALGFANNRMSEQKTVVEDSVGAMAELEQSFEALSGQTNITAETFTQSTMSVQGQIQSMLAAKEASADLRKDASFLGVSVKELDEILVGSNEEFAEQVRVLRLADEVQVKIATETLPGWINQMREWKAENALMTQQQLLWSVGMTETFTTVGENSEAFGEVITGVGDVVGQQAASMQAAFAQFGLRTQAQFDATSARASANFAIIEASGRFTAEELTRIWTEFEESRREMAEGTAETTVAMDQIALQGSSQILGAFASKNKVAAIAKATIDTVLAMQRTFAQLGWPAGIPGMAIAAALGAINVAKIASQPASFRHGTPGLDFRDFGPGSSTELHGEEAVIPRSGGHRLGREVASELGRNGGGGITIQTVQLVLAPQGDILSTEEELAAKLEPAASRLVRTSPEFQARIEEVARRVV